MTNTIAEDTFVTKITDYVTNNPVTRAYVTKITDFVTNSTSEQIIVTEFTYHVTIVSNCRKIREDERLYLLAGRAESDRIWQNRAGEGRIKQNLTR